MIRFFMCSPGCSDNKPSLTKSLANAMLLEFTYHDNYVDLIGMELNSIASVSEGARLKTFAVLGSGPLPMTSICIVRMSRKRGEVVSVRNFDRDPWAISKSSELCRKLGYEGNEINFGGCDVQRDTPNLRDFDVVYLASLLGITDEEKQDVISKTVKRMRQGALLVIRSAHSLRGLLYPVCGRLHATGMT